MMQIHSKNYEDIITNRPHYIASVPKYTGLNGEVVQLLKGRVIEVTTLPNDTKYFSMLSSGKMEHGVTRLSEEAIFIDAGVKVLIGSGVVVPETKQEIKIEFEGPKTITHGQDCRRGLFDLLLEPQDL